MKNLLINIGKKSKKAFAHKLSSKMKNKVLKNYCNLIYKNKKLIINENKKDLEKAIKKKIKDNLLQRLILDDKKIFFGLKFLTNLRTLSLDGYFSLT